MTEWWPASVQDLDAVVTSPPFFASTRFHAGNWMRLWFTGWEAEDFRVQPASFVDERQKRGFNVYEPVFRQCRERLKRGGVVVLHLGGSRKCDMAEELGRVARPWFQVADTYVESVAHCEPAWHSRQRHDCQPPIPRPTLMTTRPNASSNCLWAAAFTLPMLTRRPVWA